MDEDLPIWTRDDIVRFTHDAELEIRSWAWMWLCMHHPEEAGRQAARGLADPFYPIALEVLKAFEAHPTPEAAIAIEALRGRGDLQPALREAIERLGRPKDPPSAAEVEQQRDRDPEALRRRAPAMLRSGDHLEQLRALSALRCQQHRWATDVILEHFAALLTSHEDEAVWDALGELCDPRSMPAILAAWSPGQCVAAKTYARIHHLAGLSGPLPEGVARDADEAARYDERRNAFHRANGMVSYPGPRRIDFLCLACRRTGEYECDPPTMAALARAPRHPKKGQRAKPGFTCKFCGTADAFELPIVSMFSVIGATMAYEEDGEGRE